MESIHATKNSIHFDRLLDLLFDLLLDPLFDLPSSMRSKRARLASGKTASIVARAVLVGDTSYESLRRITLLPVNTLRLETFVSY